MANLHDAVRLVSPVETHGENGVTTLTRVVLLNLPGPAHSDVFQESKVANLAPHPTRFSNCHVPSRRGIPCHALSRPITIAHLMPHTHLVELG